MHVLVPAKINLHLRVGPPRADGFHPLLTWMTTISLFDRLTLSDEPAPGQVRMTCTEASLPCDDRNLVIKAARLLRQNSGDSVAIHLEKNIPHGGGLGGGSADAAFTLIALNQFWNLGKSIDQLSQLAAQLGSDISFFLHGPSSICTGRGEVVAPTRPPSRAGWAVLILPAIAMPTPAVYRQFDAMDAGCKTDIDTQPDWQQWASLGSQELLAHLVNDLEPPALVIEPKLQALQLAIEQIVQRPVRMSGSGSSLFTLFDTATEATAAAREISQAQRVRASAVELSPVV